MEQDDLLFDSGCLSIASGLGCIILDLDASVVIRDGKITLSFQASLFRCVIFTNGEAIKLVNNWFCICRILPLLQSQTLGSPDATGITVVDACGVLRLEPIDDD